MCLLYPESRTCPGTYIQTSGRETGLPATERFGKGGGRPAFPRNPVRPVHITDAELVKDGVEAEGGPDDDAPLEDIPEEYGEEEAEDAEGESYLEDFASTVDTLHEVLSVTSNKLKAVTLGRKFRDKKTMKPRLPPLAVRDRRQEEN